MFFPEGLQLHRSVSSGAVQIAALGDMQQFPMNPLQQQSNLAAMMWQMSMAAPHPNPAMVLPGMPGMPPWPPHPSFSASLNVRVDGLTFEYQLTEDDVRKVFSRYGEVVHVNVDREGTTAQVTFEQPHQAMAAQRDLDKKQLAGMSGAYLRVEFNAQPYDTFAHMAVPNPFMPHMMPNAGMAFPPMPPAMSVAESPSGQGGRPKKYTCKPEVGIENEGGFRVASRVIQIARQIWQDNKFQEHGGKTRLRGKGIGGPHEADEPLALCISCKDKGAFDKAVQHAESQLQKVHADYKAYCISKGRPVPDLAVKMNTTLSGGPADKGSDDDRDLPRGERPSNAPTNEEIEDLIEQRNEARKAANFKRADEVRDILKSRGVVLMDEKGAKGNFKGVEVTKWRFWRP